MIPKLSRKIRGLLSATTSLHARKNTGQLKALVLRQPILVASLIVTSLIVPVKQLGILQSLEVAVFDRMVRSQPEAKPDPRLLVVALTETDIQKLKQWPLSDATYPA